jgi:methyl-accepting chemotaxis protein
LSAGDFILFTKNNHDKAELEALGRSHAVIHFTPDGIILNANDNFLNAMGYTLDEIKGKHHRIFCDPAYAKSDEYKQFWHKLASGEFFSAQFKRFGKGGKEIWIEATYDPIFDHHGKVTRVVKYATDITERQLRFADYEGQLAAIRRAQAVIEFDMDGTILTANENFCTTVGYQLDEIQGKHHSLFVDASYAKSLDYQKFWSRLRAGEYFIAEYQRFGKGGREIWISATYNPIFDMNGKPFKVVKYATDITEQKLVSADARGQIDTIGKTQIVIEFDLDGTILTANKNFTDALGYSLAEIQGKHHRIFVDPAEANSSDYLDFWDKLRRGEFDARVYRRIKKNGDDIWIQATYNPIFDTNGRPFKIVKYATDVTDIIKTAAIAEETVTHSQSVATAVSEMNASIGEISKNVHMSKDAAFEILDDSARSSAAAQQLRSSMKVMENVVQLINNIARQVNLLALNATIEAARAGDAGKGFAVVAAEVKNLSNQTTKATDDIAKQIQDVQDVSSRVAESISTIVSSANNVNQYIMGVASAIEEQSAVTKDISDNTQKMATSVEIIAQRIKQLSAA